LGESHSSTEAPANGDRVLLAGAAAGREEAQRRLFDAHFAALYFFLRMVLPEPSQAERAAVDALARAVERRGECPAAPGSTRAWLRELALEAVPFAAVTPQPSKRRAVVTRARAETLAGVRDHTLAALVRSLELPCRQALVLGIVAGYDAEKVAAMMGIAREDVAALQHAGLDVIAGHLAAYQRETRAMGEVAREAAYHQRPLPGPMSDGIIVVRGTRAYVDQGPSNGFMYMALKALERVLGRLVGHQPGDELEDDVGDPGEAPRRPETTAAAREFERPKPTPSMREYRTPGSTPGIATYRQPRSTPSTARLSAPRRPLPGIASFGTRRARL